MKDRKIVKRIWDKKYRETHKVIISERNKKYNKENKEKLKEYQNIYYKKRVVIDSAYKLRRNLRRRINIAIHGLAKSDSTMKLLGCDIEYFKKYIEKRFNNNMNWENYGKNGWEIDHIRPCSSFDLLQEEEQRKCFNYTNLQPLWSEDNKIKSNKIIN